MHYRQTAFSRNGKNTIEVKSGVEKPSCRIGGQSRLSEIDAREINKLYKCSDSSGPKTTTTTTTTTVEPPEECVDNYNSCARWSERNFCKNVKFTKFMLSNCAKSCDDCGDDGKVMCEDSEEELRCQNWAKQDDGCNEFQSFMSVYCKKTCNLCPASASTEEIGDCRDVDKNCKQFAEYNYCTTDLHETWMRLRCKKSCNFC